MTGHDTPEKADVGLYKWSALLVVVIGTFMVMLDSSIVNIAIPKMMNVFGSDLETVKWILTGYTLAMGAVVPITGFISDTFGIKKLFIGALGLFTIGSFLCGFAWSTNTMIVFRVIQAIGGGAIMPVGMSYIMQIFPMHERGKALGFWGIASMSAPAIGPTLGGYIIQYMDWRFIFYVNVPVGVIGVIVAALLLRETPLKPYKGNFDYVGFISSIFGIVSLLYVFGEGNSIDWGNVKFPLILTFGLFSLLIFVVNELTHPEPLLELRVFKVYNFTLSQFITGVTTLAMMGGMYVLPLFLQNIRGYTAMETGLILFPSAIASGLMMPISGALFDKYGAKVVTIPGLMIVAFATYEMSMFNMNTSMSTITLVATLRGIGLGFAMMPVNTAGLNDVPRHLYGKATALSTTVRSILSALAITFMTTMISTKSSDNYAQLTEQITPFNHASNSLLKGLQGIYMKNGLTQGDAQGSALTTLGKMIYAQAYLDAINYVIAITVFAVVIAIFLVLMMRSSKKPKNKEPEKSLVKGEVLDGAGSEARIATILE
ncbi:DHA2 family efflux MFS transporter permease subunit [Desulfosporosinus sp.]|uniref:DHA2 family efflux MFS transporter permease subunit n=1 Tax=Desulfosporosinus sp. TaxID=157907 RepID=UPI002310B744|nr:DHA2 family efflux MFS transporter permease subunit [Desulfosporosinus sp.]MDA8221455.1 DHA2 family efflux MFS transporter permease subunit [Desulfitobacterium hafniense]